jgi:hypothetical protein
MQPTPWNLRGLAIAVWTLCAGLGACSDSTSVRSNRNAGPGTDLQQVSSPSAQLARQRLAKKNPSDWVGTGHNLILDDFRREMKRPGVLTRNVCGYLVDLVTRGDRLPSSRRADAPLGVASARAVAANSALCKPKAAVGGTALVRIPGPQDITLSTEASALLDQVQAVTESASDPGDLAVKLSQVLDNTYAVSDVEREIVQATVSVAQHSFEYWQVALPAFQQEMLNEYGACARQQRESGSTLDDARSACLEGGSVDAVSLPLGRVSVPFKLPMAFPPECGLSKNFKKLAGSDVSGGIVGAIRGAKMGGWAGVLPGAMAGAAFASASTFVESTWDLFWCAMT